MACTAQTLWELITAVAGTGTNLLKQVVKILMSVPIKGFVQKIRAVRTWLETILVSVSSDSMVNSALISMNVIETIAVTQMQHAQTVTGATCVYAAWGTLATVKHVKLVSAMIDHVRPTLNVFYQQAMIVSANLVSSSTIKHAFAKTLMNALIRKRVRKVYLVRIQTEVLLVSVVKDIHITVITVRISTNVVLQVPVM